MAHTNTGIISQPVSFADVNTVLGTSHTDLATMCMDSHINMWAARKPIYNTKVGILTNDDWKGNGRTLSGYKTGGGIKKWANVYAQYISGINTSTGSVVSQIWAYDKPVADGSCAFRLADFNGYYHNVGRCFSIGTLFGNISNILIPSADGQTGRTVAFTMGFLATTPDGGIAAAQLFGDCASYYPAVIFNNGSSGSNSYNYAKTAPHPISYYAGSSVTINVDTAEFAAAIAADFRAAHSGEPYANYPLRTGDNWTACMVLLSTSLGSDVHKVPSAATIVRLEYGSGVDRKTLPLKQTKYMTIEWMKMKITIQRVGIQSGYEVYKLAIIEVTAKMLDTSSITFVVDAVISVPAGYVNIQNVGQGSSVSATGYIPAVTFSGATGEVTKTYNGGTNYNETKFYVSQSASSGNKLCNGTLTFKNSLGNFSGTFSIDISSQSYQYEKEVNLL